jgi:hypothetical protein
MINDFKEDSNKQTNDVGDQFKTWIGKSAIWIRNSSRRTWGYSSSGRA